LEHEIVGDLFAISFQSLIENLSSDRIRFSQMAGSRLWRLLPQHDGAFWFAWSEGDHCPSLRAKVFELSIHAGQQLLHVVPTRGSMLGPKPVDFFEYFVFFHSSRSHQLGGRANVGASEPKRCTSSLNAGAEMMVIDVPAVPSQQIVHSMSSGQANMNGIVLCYCGYNAAVHQVGDERGGLRRAGQQWHAAQAIQPCGGKGRIALANFPNDGLRDEQFEVLPPRLPPVLGRFLVSRQPQVPAPSRDQVARNRGFEIEPRLQALRVCTAVSFGFRSLARGYSSVANRQAFVWAGPCARAKRLKGIWVAPSGQIDVWVAEFPG
jgi:hypothetical protein